MDVSKKLKPELLEIAKSLGLENYESLKKSDLIDIIIKKQGELLPIVNEQRIVVSETREESPKEIKPLRKVQKPLSQVADYWKKYLERINSTPEMFLERYPNHPFKNIILEIQNDERNR